MKLYLDSKKLFNLILLVFLVALPVIPLAFSSAQTMADLKNKISQKDSDIAKLEEEIKVYQKQLDDIDQQKNSLSKSIKELDLNRKKLVADPIELKILPIATQRNLDFSIPTLSLYFFKIK